MNICVLLSNKSFFGAIIAYLPFFNVLKQTLPNASITVISLKKEIKIIENLGFIDQIFITKDNGISFFDTIKFIRKGNFDILFTFRRKSEHDWLLNLLSNIPVKVGYKRKWSFLVYTHLVNYSKTTYRATNFLKLLTPFIEDPVEYMPLFPNIKCKSSPSIWLIPAGSKKNKLWGINNYIVLAEQILDHLNKDVTFVLGPDEKRYVKTIEKKMESHKNKVHFLVEKPLKTLLIEVNNCIMAVTNDCGPGHIPQISNKPTLILFDGNANIYEWVNKEGQSSEIFTKNQLITSISVERIYKKVKEEIIGMPKKKWEGALKGGGNMIAPSQ